MCKSISIILYSHQSESAVCFMQIHGRVRYSYFIAISNFHITLLEREKEKWLNKRAKRKKKRKQEDKTTTTVEERSLLEKACIDTIHG